MKYTLLFILLMPFSVVAQESVFLEDLTWMEVRNKMAQGATTVLIPTGGTEQNGPHMVLGKHNYIIRHTAEAIARRLGNALIAPVMAYVPEGNTSPPSGHMRFSGTLSVRESTFVALLEDTARSLKQHGFTTLVLLGDSGGNQEGMRTAVRTLSREWKDESVRVLYLAGYYRKNGQHAWLLEQGFRAEQLEKHAGIEDTSELLAAHPEGVRMQLRAAYSDEDYDTTGATGDATQTSAALGEALLELKINTAVAAIRALTPQAQAK